MSILKEFKEFAMRGNVIDLAVGVIIGSAFGKIVTSFVNDITMPLINPLIPGGDWRTMEVGPGIKIGSFSSTVLDFLIIALVIFLVVRAINIFKKKEEAKPSAPPADIVLLSEIRDLLKSKQL
ncbi:large conductance mechanosensitive channel protein MscL [Chryseosolibacter indicus]|uniref:Large-conductance mechanosensitive channel n=1 Tax=Chryseosolibacter indicus TaxID=2782351 RepID=A0ABS5VXD8_9BACT|nr:large conductance mechanosensitive channel protein MscL [Chryseosolibacter indicus]MBT1705409.1 large conductance mechanosensitive channel protein MscL [Chryseosolibacter indicus]